MKKITFLISLLILSFFVFEMTCDAMQSKSILNNKILSPANAIKDGDMVMICYDKISDKTHNDMEIYNSRRMDKFIININNGNKDMIRIVKYVDSSSRVWVNKLYELRYDGNEKIEIDYDVYSNPNIFIPLQPSIFYSILKRNYPDSIWYGAYYSKNNKDCGSLISFYKSSIIS